MGVALGCCVLELSNRSSALVQLTGAYADPDEPPEPPVIDHEEEERFRKALLFFVEILDAVIERSWDDNALPFLHTTLVFLFHVSSFEAAMQYIEGKVYWKSKIPWKRIAQMMNIFVEKCEKANFEPQLHGKEIPPPHKGETLRRLPEDYAMQGLIWSEKVYPKDWLGGEIQDEKEKYINLPSMAMVRLERMLWLGKQMCNCLIWDDATRQFSVIPEYDVPVNPVPDRAPNAGEKQGKIMLEILRQHKQPETIVWR